MIEARYLPSGDQALVVEFGKEIREDINDKVVLLCEAMKQADIEGIRDLIPTYRSLMICFDKKKVSAEQLKVKIQQEMLLSLTKKSSSVRRIITIPVCYGARFGLDLHDAQKLTGLTADEIIELHTKPIYRIYMLGFLPGFPYLGGLSKQLYMPRLENPRVKIPAGAVGIGGSQTGIYPVESPGGWRILGGTPLELYDLNRENPILYQSGDYIKFRSISLDEYYDIRWKIYKGTYKYDRNEEVQEWE